MSLSELIASVVDNPEGFGPSNQHLPAQFKDIPYAPFSKNDKLGRVVDWNLEASAAAGPAAGAQRRAGAPQGSGKYGREPKEAFGAGSAGTFAYFHDEDEASFSLVDGNKGAAAKRGGAAGGGLANLGRTGQFNRGGGRGGARGGAAGGRGGAQAYGRAGQQGRQDYARAGGKGARGATQGGRVGWKDWNKEQRTRDASVVIASDWAVLEEIEFTRLAKLRLEVDTTEVETVSSHGFLYEYDKTYDRVTTKTEKPLQIIDRIRYNPTTSDDPIIQELAAKDKAQIFATDAILSMLMCTTRTVYPWDIVITREGDKLYMDKREGGPFDFPSVNENAADPPLENEKDTLNTPSSLSLEATYINQNFAFQVVREDTESRIDLENPNPFYSPEETEPLASCGYRYRKFDLSITEDEDVQLIVRTEVDSFVKSAGAAEEDSYITIKTLNEFDSRAQGSGGAPDWRTKLDSQRGAVVATEMKNNSSKLARYAVQSILAGAEQMKMGYVSRANPRDSSRHTILGTQWYKPREFASQMNISLANGWGIVRTIADLCFKQPEGKYVLLKDPNKPVVRLYRVPYDAFETVEDVEEEIPLDAGSDGGL
ncbi:eukaryotic translation initiation factor 3 subunit D [Leucosporidium creatinivorum]|uniref:Eukaryotic translation initiation factor 3 subunit D n=1 Tax=Leucosporidium creatinivorum TaxID=106004 RepID=A0A1Y2G2I4_9BASI|nr:eukaryotic translation initiation factor 3 subunit D [Leucosporidium creatinivorum]